MMTTTGWRQQADDDESQMRAAIRSVVGVSLALLLVTALPAAPARAADGSHSWPSWRGPLSTGVSPDGNPPVHWSEKDNVRFKVELPGRGLASPVVWNDRIFILAAAPIDADAYARSQEAAAEKQKKRQWPPSVDPVAQRFLVLAYSLADGRLLWQRTAVEKMPNESHYIDASWASASPVTDGERLFVHFGSNGTFAYDLDGKLLWKTDLGDMTTRNGFGEGSSPALHGDTLVINWDHEGSSFVVALNTATGEQRWKVGRPEEVTSWSTPLIVQHDGRAQVVTAATGKSRAYDLETGKEIWSIGGMTLNTIPSPMQHDGIVYLTSGYRGNMMQAISLEHAHGDLEKTDALVWSHDRDTPYVPSPLLDQGSIFFLKHNRNIVSNLDARTGEVSYNEQRLPGIHNVYASPVGAAGRIYVFDRDGHSVVLESGSEFKVLAENTLDDGVDASPAIVGSDLLVRGQKYLYCLTSIEKATAKNNATDASAVATVGDNPAE